MIFVLALLFLVAAGFGWQRAARRGGTTADRAQYALAHAIPAFLIGLIVVVAAANFGWLG